MSNLNNGTKVTEVSYVTIMRFSIEWHSIVYTFFFISNPIFRLSLELVSEVPKMRLKIAMKLLTFFGDYWLK